MRERINDKIEQIVAYLEDLSEMMEQISLDDYIKNVMLKAACERFIERIVGALVDLGSLVIRERKFEPPETESQIFEILRKNNLISEDLCESLNDAKRMRNVIAHQYAKIDDNIVYEAVTEQLANDSQKFIENIKNSLNENRKVEDEEDLEECN